MLNRQDLRQKIRQGWQRVNLRHLEILTVLVDGQEHWSVDEPHSALAQRGISLPRASFSRRMWVREAPFTSIPVVGTTISCAANAERFKMWSARSDPNPVCILL